MSFHSSAHLLTLAREVAIKAAELAARRRAEGVEVAATKSSAVDVVTHADREVEQFIRAALAAVRPDDGFYGEESDATDSASGITWVVDPIDGTVNYLYGIPNYAVSIAAVQGDADPASWEGLAGVVINPANGELFSAHQGGGAFLGDRQIHANTDVELNVALLGTGFSYSAEERVRQGRVLAELIGQVRDIRRQGAAALDLCSVAAGRLDAYAEKGLNPWDYSAGALITREAGARVSGFDGERESIAFTLAASEGLAAQLEPILAELYTRHGLR